MLRVLGGDTFCVCCGTSAMTTVGMPARSIVRVFAADPGKPYDQGILKMDYGYVRLPDKERNDC